MRVTPESYGGDPVRADSANRVVTDADETRAVQLGNVPHGSKPSTGPCWRGVPFIPILGVGGITT